MKSNEIEDVLIKNIKFGPVSNQTTVLAAQKSNFSKSHKKVNEISRKTKKWGSAYKKKIEFGPFSYKNTSANQYFMLKLKHSFKI